MEEKRERGASESVTNDVERVQMGDVVLQSYNVQ